MKQLPINSTDKHPEPQVEPRMATGQGGSEIPTATHRHSLLTLLSSPASSAEAIAKADVERAASPERSRWELRNPTSNFRNCDDPGDMEQVEYSERPYLSDEKWFV